MTGGDPAEIPADWFSRVTELAPDKRWAVMETNHLAEDFMHPTLGIEVPGRDDRLLIPSNAEFQARYVQRLLTEAYANGAEFVTWWTLRDLDLLERQLNGWGNEWGTEKNPMAGLARDCGIYDGEGNARPSRGVWERWLALPKR